MKGNIKLLREYISTSFTWPSQNMTLNRSISRRNSNSSRDWFLPTSTQSTQDAADEEYDNAPKAACCLISNKEGKILSVSRRDDPTDMGMPGGKVDSGETAEQACIRELEEETGIVAYDPKLVFQMFDGTYLTLTFAVKIKDGKINTDEEGVIRWVDPQVLVTNSSFSEYNRKMFKTLGWDVE